MKYLQVIKICIILLVVLTSNFVVHAKDILDYDFSTYIKNSVDDFSCQQADEIIEQIKKEKLLLKSLISTAEKYKNKLGRNDHNHLSLINSIHKYNHQILLNELKINAISHHCGLDTEQFDSNDLCKSLEKNLMIVNEEFEEEEVSLYSLEMQFLENKSPQNSSDADWQKYYQIQKRNSEMHMHSLEKELDEIGSLINGFCQTK